MGSVLVKKVVLIVAPEEWIPFGPKWSFSLTLAEEVVDRQLANNCPNKKRKKRVGEWESSISFNFSHHCEISVGVAIPVQSSRW